MASGALFFILITLPIIFANEQHKREGFLDRLTTGMKFAHDFLGSESVALKVADFVVRTFNTVNNPSPRKKQPQPVNDDYTENTSSEENGYEDIRPNNIYQTSSPISPWRHLIRLLGLQPNQISAVAVNALVFVAQIISTFLSGARPPSKLYRSEDPMTWILNKKSRKLQDLITATKNESLTDLLEEAIEEQESQEETSCIRLLVCKITPFINKMQNTVFGKDDMTNTNKSAESFGAAILYRHLPSTEEVYNRNDFCEKRHTECDLNE